MFHKKLLTADELAAVAAKERSARPMLGVLAINAGLMNAAQVEAVHEQQKRQDKRFGELAVAAGYITMAQLEDLLQLQHQRHVHLSQAIIDCGYMSLSELETALQQYREESGLTPEAWQLLHTMDYEGISKALLQFDLPGAAVYHDYMALLQRNMVRFLQAEPVLAPNGPVTVTAGRYVVHQIMEGEGGLAVGLAMDDTVLLAIASQYSGETLTVVDELAVDSVMEFLNVVNGIFCVNASAQGLELELTLQRAGQTVPACLAQGHQVPVSLPFGQVDVLLAAV